LLGLATTTGYVLQEDILALQVGENDGSMLFTLAGETAVNANGTANETTPVITPDTGEAVGTVTAPDGINMRTGPGTTYPSLTIVPNGATLSLLGISEDGEWWLIENPDLPGEQAWVSTNFIQAKNAEDVPIIEEPPALTDYPWQWLSLTTPAETTTVSDPSLYTIQFRADGTAVIKIDCNNATASYTTDKNAININLGATTLVACPGDSLDALYFDTLTRVTTYSFDADNLVLELPANGGTMKFAPQS
jgi:heat shock protein HslJ